MKNNTNSSLLTSLFSLLEAHRSGFRQARTYRRATSLLLSEVFAFARHTVSQGLLVLGLTDADWSAWYRLFSRARYQEEALSICFFQQTLLHVTDQEPYVIGCDGVQVPRSSHKMPGTGWLKAPRTAPFRAGIHRAQRFVHLSWLLPIQQGFSRALPLRFLPAFPDKAVPAEAGSRCKEWQAALRAVQWVRQHLDAAGRQAQWLLMLGDGAYDRSELWKALPERTVLAVRTAKNRILRELPGPYSGHGRRCKYGPRICSPHEWLHQPGRWLRQEVEVRGRRLQLSYRVEGPFLRQGVPDRPLYLIVVRGDTWLAGKKAPKRKYRAPCFYLVNAVPHGLGWQLPFASALLLAWLWQRWELEVTHRELKSGLGLGEKQCWNPRAAVASVQWSAWVYAVLVLAGFRTWGLFDGPKAPARWWAGARRWSLTTLWRGYRAAFWSTPHFQAIWSPSTDNWQKKEAWLLGFWNAVAAASRI